MNAHDYQEYRQGRRKAWVYHLHADIIASALLDGKGCQTVELGGRGTLLQFPYPEGFGLIRAYRRGGIIRHFSSDAFLLINRPWREFKVHKYLVEKGLQVPRLLGVYWERQGLWVRGALATQRVEATALTQALTRPGLDPKEILEPCGALIRRMHDLGVWHADLQVKNLLFGGDGPYIIDFDNAVICGGVSQIARARNLFRLRRSFEKHHFSMEYFAHLLNGYGNISLPGWLSAVYEIKGFISSKMSESK